MKIKLTKILTWKEYFIFITFFQTQKKLKNYTQKLIIMESTYRLPMKVSWWFCKHNAFLKSESNNMFSFNPTWRSSRRHNYQWHILRFGLIRCAVFTLQQWFLPFFYVKSWSNLKPNDNLESAHHNDFKIPLTCSIWWSFGWDIWG